MYHCHLSWHSVLFKHLTHHGLLATGTSFRTATQSIAFWSNKWIESDITALSGPGAQRLCIGQISNIIKQHHTPLSSPMTVAMVTFMSIVGRFRRAGCSGHGGRNCRGMDQHGQSGLCYRCDHRELRHDCGHDRVHHPRQHLELLFPSFSSPHPWSTTENIVATRTDSSFHVFMAWAS